ncbi:MAG: hypothetical protein CVU05_05040 [Bacteroidetes bacterium HGW-Bacteroidetes-21]|nr:MAG: hypothetical protein CVU05_05040 [Bacteroidetes bacterium HGW-Bacteroidetes-21]
MFEYFTFSKNYKYYLSIKQMRYFLILIFAFLFITKSYSQYGPLYWKLRGYDNITNYRSVLAAYDKKDVTGAIRILDSISNIYSSNNEFKLNYVVQNEKGAMLYLSKDYANSFNTLNNNIIQMNSKKDTLNYEYAIALRLLSYVAKDWTQLTVSRYSYLERQLNVLTLMKDSSEIAADCMSDFGLSYIYTDVDKGLPYLLKAKSLCKKLKMKRSLMVIDNTLANQLSLEQPYLSIQIQKNMLQTAGRKNYADSIKLTMLAYLLAYKCQEVELFEEAIHYFHYADSIMHITNNPQYKLIAAIPLGLAQCYSKMGNKDQFVEYINIAQNAFNTISESRSMSESMFNLIVGSNYIPFNTDSALYYLQKAQDILSIESESEKKTMSIILNSQALAFQKKGNLDDAIQKIFESIKIFAGSDENNDPNFICTNGYDNELKESYLIACDLLSENITNIYSKELYDKTLNCFYCCDTLMRRLAINISDEKAIFDYSKRYKQLTGDILKIQNLTNQNPEIAFHFVCNSKAFQLMADIKRHSYISTKDDSLWRKKIEIEKNIKLITNKKTNATSNQLKTLNDSLANIEKDMLLDLMVINYEIMKHRKADNQYFINEDLIRITQNNIEEEHLIIDIYQTEKKAFIFSVSKNELSCFTIDNVEKLDSIANQFYISLKTGGNSSASASMLSDLILKPIASNLSKRKSITFIPDNILYQVPFEVLPNPNNGKMLIYDYSINYHYSTALWNKSQRNETPKEYSLLAIAPVFEKNKNLTIDSYFKGAHLEDDYLNNIKKESLCPLPYTLEEVEEIGKLFKTQETNCVILTKKDANKHYFFNSFLNHTIIHIATHGYASKVSPNHSGFFLYSNDSNNTSYNNLDFVNMNEIYSVKTNADLVVLSACNSGVGPIYNGEGLMALPRGFIYAGVPNVLASLWKVHDIKTKVLMVAFYKHLLDGNNYAKALRLAKLDCIYTGHHPLDWAGFVLIGG